MEHLVFLIVVCTQKTLKYMSENETGILSLLYTDLSTVITLHISELWNNIKTITVDP